MRSIDFSTFFLINFIAFLTHQPLRDYVLCYNIVAIDTHVLLFGEDVAAVLAKPPSSKRQQQQQLPQQHQQQEYEFDYEFGSPVASASINHFDTFVASGGGGIGKKGFSVGSGLRSIAQGSADQANTAVANQHAAAKQAAYVAKNTLAQAAAQASATAQAALAGKQVIFSGLEQQVRDAKVALDGETMQLQSAQRAANAAQQAAQQAAHQVSKLKPKTALFVLNAFLFNFMTISLFENRLM